MKISNFKFQIFNVAGFSLIEVILAVALFMLLGTSGVTVVLQGLRANRLGAENTVANQFASEGIEAVKSIKNQAYANVVTSGGTGIIRNGSFVWQFSGSNNTLQHNVSDNYTRVIAVDPVQRDGTGNIVSSGTLDPDTKKVTSTVTWNFSAGRPETLSLSTYLSDWRKAIGSKGGMLVYGDGGTTTDALKYKIFDTSGNFGTVGIIDVDGATANKAARALRLYASATRNEKILLSRHYNGTAQFIYASVWNGTTWVSTQLSTWTAATFLDIQNFDGTYLSNGSFMVIYSDNTVIPKARIWNGTTWAGQTSLTTLGASQIPNYIVAAARPGSNEVMAAFFTRGAAATSANTITQYYNGTTWSAITTHGTLSITNTKRSVDFVWSGNTPTIGGLIFANTTTDKTIRVRTGTASGGVFTWGTTGLSAAQTSNLGALNITARPNTANEFVACNKDSAATPRIICYRVTHAATPTFSAATTLAAATDTGIQKSSDTGYENLSTSGTIGLSVYSDNTTTPKLKKFNASTAWDGAATSLQALLGVVKTVRVIPQPSSDDMMILFSDASLDLSSVMWNGTNNAIYSPFIGNTSVETNVDSTTTGTAESMQVTATNTGSFDNITIFLDTTSTATTVIVGLYTNSGSNHPGTLLGQGSSSTLVNGAWNKITIPSVSVTSGTPYWFSILGTGGTPRFRDRVIGCAAETSSQTTLTTLPATWTTGTVYTGCPLSAFGTINNKSFTQHGINGSAITDYWYDFVWDNF